MRICRRRRYFDRAAGKSPHSRDDVVESDNLVNEFDSAYFRRQLGHDRTDRRTARGSQAAATGLYAGRSKYSIVAVAAVY